MKIYIDLSADEAIQLLDSYELVKIDEDTEEDTQPEEENKVKLMGADIAEDDEIPF